MYEILIEKIAQLRSAVNDYLQATPVQSIQGDRGSLKLAIQELEEAFSTVPVPEGFKAGKGEPTHVDKDQVDMDFEKSNNPHAERNQDGTLKNEIDRIAEPESLDAIGTDSQDVRDEEDDKDMFLTYPMDMVLDIARECHATNREYCMSLGDDSQVPFDEAPKIIQQSVIDGVKGVLENSEITPEQSHDNWVYYKSEEGWEYGETKDIEAKLHPNLVPFNDLPETEQLKDKMFIDTVRQIIGE